MDHMKGTAADIDVVDWLVIKNPANKADSYAFHLPFMFSNWGCLYGRGQCPSMIFKEQETYSYDLGCCADGAYLVDTDELARLQALVDLLSPEEMPEVKLDLARKNWSQIVPDEQTGEPSVKTLVHEGACIFSNKFGEQKDGKIGCAFLHLAARLTEERMEDVNHTLTMPTVCWQLPIKAVPREDPTTGGTRTYITPWDAHWWVEHGDREFDDLEFWCVDSKEAYSYETVPFFRRYRVELQKTVGAGTWIKAYRELNKRYAVLEVSPMPAASPNGRKLIPIAIKGRTEIRKPV